MMFKSSSPALVGAAAIFILLPVITQASAAGYLEGIETKIIPAANCVVIDGMEATVSSKSNLYNQSYTTAANVLCPIQYATHGLDAPTGFVLTFTDNSTVSNFHCYVSILGLDGKTVVRGLEVTYPDETTASGNAMTVLAPDNIIEGAWHVNCRMPPRRAGDKSSVLSTIAVYQTGIPL